MRYIIRLDDACPTMDWNKWNKIITILDKLNIKAIIAVIPNNEDEKMLIDKYNPNFWKIVRQWQNNGHYIALHGYNHKYISKNSGLIPMNKQSEFAGIDIKIQREKIKKGWEIFQKEKIKCNIWVSPSHTFDENTLKVLKKETDINIISDGITYYPYVENGFLWIPQQLWWYEEKKEGVWTICLHPNNMSDKQINDLENILRNNVDKFIFSFDEIINQYKNRKKTIKDKVYFHFFFLKRNFYKTKLFQILYKILKG